MPRGCGPEVTILIIGNIQAVVKHAISIGLTTGTYVPVTVRNAHDVFRGRNWRDLEIIYVQGADLVLDQPGIRMYVAALLDLGARERVG